MKIALYMDVYPGQDMQSVSAYSRPGSLPPEYGRRYKIEVEIPDPNEPHATVQGTATRTEETAP